MAGQAAEPSAVEPAESRQLKGSDQDEDQDSTGQHHYPPGLLVGDPCCAGADLDGDGRADRTVKVGRQLEAARQPGAGGLGIRDRSLGFGRGDGTL